MTEGVTGKDLRTGEQLSPAQQTASLVGGVLGARASASTVNKVMSGAEQRAAGIADELKLPPPPPPQVATANSAPATNAAATDDALAATRMESRGHGGNTSARGAKFEEQALAKAQAEHPEGFKPDIEAQRLGYTNLNAADWVGLESVKGGKFVAHITEATVGKNKSLSEVAKQLDGAQKITSAKMGEQIKRYEYYVRTNNKELADAIRLNNNQVRKPGVNRGSFDVKVIFEGGGR